MSVHISAHMSARRAAPNSERPRRRRRVPSPKYNDGDSEDLSEDEVESLLITAYTVMAYDYGLHSSGVYSYDLHSYCLGRDGLYSCGLYSNGLYSIAYIIVA